MSIISTTTKAKAAAKVARGAVQHPGPTAKLLGKATKLVAPAGKAGAKASRSIVKRRVRKRAEGIGDAARAVGEAALLYGQQAAWELGLAQPPKPKRTAPRLAAGMIVGATAVYFLEPDHGKEHRDKLAAFVS